MEIRFEFPPPRTKTRKVVAITLLAQKGKHIRRLSPAMTNVAYMRELRCYGSRDAWYAARVIRTFFVHITRPRAGQEYIMPPTKADGKGKATVTHLLASYF